MTENSAYLGITARQIPDDYVEMTADVVRMARAAEPGTKADAIIERMKRQYPERTLEDIKKSVGYAAALLTRQLQD